MAQSSPTVHVMVEGDFLPPLRGTLIDAVGSVVSRPGKTVKVSIRPITGAPGTDVTAAWDDAPANTRPILAWTSGNILGVGVWYGRFKTDPAGSAQWSFPTEDEFTIIVKAKTA